ncbi:cobW-domain-containing protein [Suhomyces tanzawaensis NRRL Y-17324]|uniref:CobW-domain-containing protein n=1 Tax=Suhomyces tanzawaensis NRRL Y-17324 TaxID=984487 RepID=A0A1E4SE32_9ASCO|nr:cobW-domain-containing protein [Suhomyces tanzawaensis NRRL Y-17324]ODV77779.1 cobW-domain-containing protein [Suhomyces tanzawaensis NRRL Y-17324]
MPIHHSKSVKKSHKLPIPITLLSGFLGSGKTTLLERILTTDHGLKVAVIINDVSQLNIDAALIQDHKVTKKEEKLIQLQNGCICCTLRGDLLEEFLSLAKNGDFQYIIIESTGISEPMQVAETFTTEFTEMLLQTQGSIPKDEEKILNEIVELGGLTKLTKLDTCVTVVDSVNFMSNFETTDFLVDRFGDNGQGERERTITDLMVDQIEFADVIIVNKVSSMKKKNRKKISKIIKSLNPIAKVIHADYCNVDIKDVVNTKRFDFEKASTSAGWLQSINEMTIREGFGNKNQSTLTPKPETEEYGITNFVYKSRRPFHPERLYKMMYDKFVIIEQSGIDESENTNESGEQFEQLLDEEQEDEGEDEELENDSQSEDGDTDDDSDLELPELTEKQLLKNKKRSAFGPMLRSKGFFWIASRHIIRGEWSSAGSMLHMKGGIPWFAVTGPSYFPPEARKLIEKDMQGEYGDRRNELVFIGVNIDKRRISSALDSCLLTDEEFAEFESVVKDGKNLYHIEKSLQATFNDGFESWIKFDDDEDDTPTLQNTDGPAKQVEEEKKDAKDNSSKRKKAKAHNEKRIESKSSKNSVNGVSDHFDTSINGIEIQREKHGNHSHVRVKAVKT